MEEVDQELEALRMKKAGKLMNQDLMPKEIIKLHTAEEYKKFAEEHMDEAIDSLTLMQREPYKKYKQGKSVAEIAKELNIGEPAVYGRLSRADERIKKYLKNKLKMYKSSEK